MCRHWWLVPSAHRERQMETYRLVNTNLLCVMWRNQATGWPSLSVFVQSQNKHFSNLSQHCTRKRKLQLILSEYFSECVLYVFLWLSACLRLSHTRIWKRELLDWDQISPVELLTDTMQMCSMPLWGAELASFDSFLIDTADLSMRHK